MKQRSLRIVSNIARLPQSFPSGAPLAFSYIGECGAFQFLLRCLRADLLILDADDKRLLLACMLKWVLPMLRLRIVSVDLILRAPTSFAARVKARVKWVLFRRVDRFLLFFKDLSGCAHFYGIGPDRAVYVPFKVNGWEQISMQPRGSADGDYVLCAGRTQRDIETFVEAMRRADCPGVLLQQKRELLAEHGTAQWCRELPPNVKLVVDESDRLENYLDFISRARLVVIPRFKNDIAPTGISTYLMAMALNKCVIISAGPGAEDVLKDEAVIVPPENSDKLAQEIQSLWEDHDRRNAIAASGYEYSMSLGGYERLLADILRISLDQLALSKIEQVISEV
jgi:glycosyltransferase involved in cell wall biosynthesis